MDQKLICLFYVKQKNVTRERQRERERKIEREKGMRDGTNLSYLKFHQLVINNNLLIGRM